LHPANSRWFGVAGVPHSRSRTPSRISKKHNILVDVGSMTRFGAKGEGTSVYFRDPDRSPMEFIVYGL
jgi:hypothetical protein